MARTAQRLLSRRSVLAGLGVSAAALASITPHRPPGCDPDFPRRSRLRPPSCVCPKIASIALHGLGT